uniref:Uncharacterized protein n=1 Tax=Dunaliella tertiolecta TaxID=3047 RepID=A0A7S3QL97_DUNTE
MSCCCLYKDETDEKHEEMIEHDLSELKDVSMEIVQSNGEKGLMCCTEIKEIQCFKMVLYFTKDVGVFHVPSEEWSFANENKTSWMKTEPFVAAGSMQEAVELRRVLREAVARNAERDAAKAATRVLTNAGSPQPGNGGIKGMMEGVMDMIPM